MTALAVVESVGLATVQDGGRRGYTSVGVPVSGAWHRERYLMATALVGARVDDTLPAIEVLAGVLNLRAHQMIVMAVVGPASLTVDGRAAANGTAIVIPRGALVAVSQAGRGPTYAVVAGWQAPRTLRSAATDTFSRLGGGAVSAGQVLEGGIPSVAPVPAGVFHRALAAVGGVIRVVPAGASSADAFARSRWQVVESARSGVRLRGGTAPISGTVPSSPMVVGAVQVTPSGDAIVLGPDGGLTGGYPVAAVVATVDLDRLSLVEPGDVLAFRVITVPEAAVARDRRVRSLRRAVVRPDDLG